MWCVGDGATTKDAIRVWRTRGGTATVVAVVVDGMVLGSYQHRRILVRVAVRNEPIHVEKKKNRGLRRKGKEKERGTRERERRNTADDDAKTHATVSNWERTNEHAFECT